MIHERHRRPASSYHMNDPKVVFDALGLKRADSFLDIGCGAGDYSVYASKIVGDAGAVYALDNDLETIEHLKERVRSEHIDNINVIRADITKRLPLPDDLIDVCLLSTVLHVPDVNKNSDSLFQEISRVLKKEGRLFIIECSDKDLSYGPPLSMRISPQDVEGMVVKHGYKKTKTVDLGFNYLLGFGR